MFELAKKLWPLNRSITGKGLNDTLEILSNYITKLKIKKISTGTKVFDWVVPMEWDIKDAYIITPEGKKICWFKKNNLHLVSYSQPINKNISLDDLQKHLYSVPKKPNAIPYVTSYYKKSWGFCIKEKDRRLLKKGIYKVFIDSKFKKGFLKFAECIIRGKSKKEVFLSTYICHPSMANNEISGPVVTTFLTRWLYKQKKLNYTYRIIFIPETIGSLVYLKLNLANLKKRVIAGFNITCIGDERAYSYLPSRDGNSISDKVAKHVLKWIDKDFKSYTWKDRGSDERQYCAPNINLPIASIMRSKFGEYPEYHTSLDTLGKVVTEKGLEGGFFALQKAIEAIENNFCPKTVSYGEPFLSKRNLYSSISHHSDSGISKNEKLLLDILTWSDGNYNLLEIADKCDIPIWKLYNSINILKKNKLIK